MSDFLINLLPKRKSKFTNAAFQTKSVVELRDSINLKDLRNKIKLGHQEADLSWKKTYYILRTIWATLSIVLLGASLWFTYWLVGGVGTGELDFTEYKTFLNIIAGEIIIHVLGLVAIVMHFLFPKDGDPKTGVRK